MYGPKWPFLLMYGSYDMRHTSFPRVDEGQQDPRDLGRHIFSPPIFIMRPKVHFTTQDLEFLRQEQAKLDIWRRQRLIP